MKFGMIALRWDDLHATFGLTVPFGRFELSRDRRTRQFEFTASFVPSDEKKL